MTKHFKNAEEYMTKMRRLSYKSVPFGEDVSFQIALYEHGVLRKEESAQHKGESIQHKGESIQHKRESVHHKGESAQFWGLGILRIKYKSTTKRAFEKLDVEAKEVLKDMMIYLKEHGILSFNPCTKRLNGVKVIPGGRIRIRIRGRVGERPWRQAYECAFPSSKDE